MSTSECFENWCDDTLRYAADLDGDRRFDFQKNQTENGGNRDHDYDFMPPYRYSIYPQLYYFNSELSQIHNFTRVEDPIV